MGHTTLVVTLVLLASQVRASKDSGSPTSSTAKSSASPTSVQWTSPSSGATFGPGERIDIKWQAPGKTTSPSFRVCEGSGDSCGATIWPQIQQTGNVYATIVTAPEVDTQSGYYLQMTDDTGQVANTPVFNLSPNPQSASTTSTGSNPGTAQHSSTDAGTGDTQPGSSAVSSSAPLNAPNQDPMSIPATPANSTGFVTPSPMSAAVMHNAPPTLALAIPLSIVGAILLAAFVLACHHRRKLAVDRANEAILLRDAERSVSIQGFGGYHGQAALDELSRRSSLHSSNSTLQVDKASLPKLDMDVEKALLINALLTKLNGPSDIPSDTHLTAIHTSAPLPPPLSPPREPEPRTCTRLPFPAQLIPGLALNRDPPAPSAVPYESVLSSSQSQKFLYESGPEPVPTLATIPETASITSEVLSAYLSSPNLDLNKRASVTYTRPQAPTTFTGPKPTVPTVSRSTTWATLPIPPALHVQPDSAGRRVVKAMPSSEEEEDDHIDRVRAWAASGTSLSRNSSSASTLIASASLSSADQEKPLPANPTLANESCMMQ